jgi:ketosteroid isomerase-like protein
MRPSRFRLLLLVSPFLAASTAAFAQQSSSTPSSQRTALGEIKQIPPRSLDLSSPQRAMDEFFAALSSADTARYAAMLTDDATLFFTGPPFPSRRVDGRDKIIALVSPLFEKLRAAGSNHAVVPLDLQYQTWGDTSVVTFHIAGRQFDRRTFVLRRQHGAWKIAHLHASAVALEK